MDTFQSRLNTFLVKTFNGILKLEEEVIRHHNDVPLSVSEMHMIEAIGCCQPPSNTISDIAELLDITMSSVTIGVNKLIKKGFAQKEKSLTDGRSVQIALTKQGKEMDKCHKYFHYKMVSQLSKELDEQEKAALINGMEKLANFFSK